MMKAGFVVITLIVGIIALSLVVMETSVYGQTESAGQPENQKIRIGVYRSRAVALAWGRSERFKSLLDEKLYKPGKIAKKAGDKEKLKELEAVGKQMQDQSHEQVFGAAPIDNIMDEIRTDLPKLAEQAKVKTIVSSVSYGGPEIEVVDMTDVFIDYFGADETTRRMIRDIEKHPPMKSHLEGGNKSERKKECN